MYTILTYSADPKRIRWVSENLKYYSSGISGTDIFNSFEKGNQMGILKNGVSSCFTYSAIQPHNIFWSWVFCQKYT